MVYILMISNAPAEWRIYLSRLSQNIFTMVEENFVFWWPQMPQQNEGFIWAAYLRIFSPWLKKILDFDNLKFPRIKDLNHLSRHIFTMVEENFGFWWPEMPKNDGFETLISIYFHHGWRKFWILMTWNAPL